ncbi:LysR substrate-binding domain-containing protein [Acidovorax sp. NB1]|uniref:LysR substrate-binding domain-containing protein n=1 Tax=Acidovorax sp. NB1 TaxID=1943571 RepID=UPI0010D0F7F4|nr:LysR substrate-binding domain-containing protein [Acidovorax sp. NB1]GDY38823.1 transcriptional regulator [Acidovorax sp. NB1]
MKLPPLIAVRFFEATARHRSVREAARELHVTPGAVSQQVRRLEDFLGCALFERLPRGLALTPAGMDYQAACGEALARIGHATARLAAGARRVVRVSCTPDFAARWLVPRLQLFLQHAPELDVHVNSTHRAVDLLAEDMHFAVRHGIGPYPGLHAEWLLDDDLVPVCSPRLVAPRLWAQLADITGPRLLHDGQRDDWRLWCRTQGLARVDSGQGVVFAGASGAVEAALAGQGFALVTRTKVARALATRALVGLQAPRVAAPLGYRLVYRPEALIDPALRRFRDWVLDEGAQAEGISAG